MIPLTGGAYRNQSHSQKWTGGCLGLERGNGELLFNGYGISVWKDENILVMDGGNAYTTL